MSTKDGIHRTRIAAAILTLYRLSFLPPVSQFGLAIFHRQKHPKNRAHKPSHRASVQLIASDQSKRRQPKVKQRWIFEDSTMIDMPHFPYKYVIVDCHDGLYRLDRLPVLRT